MLSPGTQVIHQGKGFMATVESKVGADEYIVRLRKDGSRIVCKLTDLVVTEPGTPQVPSNVTLKSQEPQQESVNAPQPEPATGTVADQTGDGQRVASGESA